MFHMHFATITQGQQKRLQRVRHGSILSPRMIKKVRVIGADKEIAIVLWQLLSGERAIVRRSSVRKAAKIARATAKMGRDGVWRYKVNPEWAKEIRDWFDGEGKLVEPENFLASIWRDEGQPAKEKKKAKAEVIDLLAQYKAKVLSEG